MADSFGNPFHTDEQQIQLLAEHLEREGFERAHERAEVWWWTDYKEVPTIAQVDAWYAARRASREGAG